MIDETQTIIENKSEIPVIFICPITLCIMANPVVCSDGTIFEEEAIEESVTVRLKSPLTNIEINRQTYPVIILKQMINDYLEKNPDKIGDQYIPTPKKYRDVYKDNNKILSFNEDELYELFIHLYRRSRAFRYPIMKSIFCHCNSHIIKYMIDNINLEREIISNNNETRRIMDIIIAYGIEENINYALIRYINHTIWFKPACLLATMEMLPYRIYEQLLIQIKDERNFFFRVHKAVIERNINKSDILNSWEKADLIKKISKKIKQYIKKYEEPFDNRNRDKKTFSYKLKNLFRSKNAHTIVSPISNSYTELTN